MKKYEIWHDEYKGTDDVNEYWHGLYFVPTDRKTLILEKLRAIRDEHNIPYSKNVKSSGFSSTKPKSRLISNQLQLFSHSLIVKPTEATTELFNRGGSQVYRRTFNPFERLTDVWGCKFALLKVPDNHQGFDRYPMTYTKRVETTFRFAFRSGLHYLFNENIKIIGFHFDGNEHHAGGVDLKRITRGEYRDYVHFSPNIFLNDSQYVDRDEDGKLMMCLVDNSIGGLVAKIDDKPDPNNALFSVGEIVERAIEGKLDLNKNGRWYRSISFSKVIMADGEIKFDSIFNNDSQRSLFD